MNKPGAVTARRWQSVSCGFRRILSVAAGLAIVHPASGAWREASTEKFLVYSDGSESSLVDFARRVERFDAVLRAMTGAKQPPSPLQVRIYLVDGEEEVHALYGASARVKGFYTTRIGGAIAIVDRRTDSGTFGTTGQDVLFHEYTHHFARQYFPVAYPVWYQEGIADYFSSTVIKYDGTVEVGNPVLPRLPDLAQGVWLKPAEVMDTPLEKLPEHKWSMFYAQGWLLTHYLIDDPRRQEQLDKYLILRNRGVSHTEALHATLGLTDEQLAAQLRAYYLNGKVHFLRVQGLKLDVPKVTVRELPAAESALLIPDLHSELGMPEQQRPKFLTQLRRLSAPFPTDTYSQRVLGEAEARYGSAETAIKLLSPLVDHDPPDRRALLAMGSLELARKQTDPVARLASDRRVRTLAVKANRLMPDDPAALLLFYMSFRAEPNGPSENAVAGLRRAYENLPQYHLLAELLAREEFRHDRPESVVALLRPIAYSPHGGAEAQQAQSWIQAINQHQKPDFPEEAGEP